MDTAHQWPQDMGLVKPMEELVSSNTTRSQVMERRVRPQKEQALNCPRCNSTNTKFCYYNNYSLTQPRYFCKTCRRYWTEGGSLRNVPVGGGSRKNKRSCSSSSSTSSASSSLVSSTKLPSDLSSSQNPKFHEGQDLNLGFSHHNMSDFGDFINNNNITSTNSSNPSSTTGLSAMELLRSGMSASGLGPFMPMAIPETTGAMYPSGFGMQEFRSSSTLNFPLDGVGGGGYGSMQGVQESSGRLLFPFEDLRQVSSSTSTEFEQNRGQGGDHPGYWNGMIGNGGSW